MHFNSTPVFRSFFSLLWSLSEALTEEIIQSFHVIQDVNILVPRWMRCPLLPLRKKAMVFFPEAVENMKGLRSDEDWTHSDRRKAGGSRTAITKALIFSRQLKIKRNEKPLKRALLYLLKILLQKDVDFFAQGEYIIKVLLVYICS